MRRLVQSVAVTLVVALAGPARADEPATFQKQRGVLTGVGMGLVVASLLGAGLGISGVLGASDASVSLSMFPVPLPASQAPAAAAARDRFTGDSVLAGVGFGLAALSLAASIICFVVDGKPAAVSFAPTANGGAFSFSLVW